MKISTMRQLDRWLGVPACFILTLIRKINDTLRPKRRSQIRRILFVKLAEQGATVLAASAICKAAKMVGRKNVFFLVFEENRFILDTMELIPVENVISIPSKNIFSVIWGTLRAVWRMRKEKIDTAIDMEFFARSSAILTYLSGATKRIGFHAFASEASYRGDLMTHRLSYNNHLHISQIFEMMVDALNAPVETLPAFNIAPPPQQDVPLFSPKPQETEEVKNMLLKETNSDKIPPLILLNANCSDILPLRRWPEVRYVELVHRLIEKYPQIYIAFTGAPSETHYAQQLVDQAGSQRCFSLAGKTTLRQLIVLYTLAKVLVTNDSGPAQFATLTPIEIITLFGPETPSLFGAKTSRNHILWSGIVCSPCVNAYNNRLSPCRNNLCMQQISVEEVFEKVCQVYEKLPG
jgi:ADP-heptose:LPS heptosyltransferase